MSNYMNIYIKDCKVFYFIKIPENYPYVEAYLLYITLFFAIVIGTICHNTRKETCSCSYVSVNKKVPFSVVLLNGHIFVCQSACPVNTLH